MLLLIFILENSHRIDIAYFGVHGHLPLGVALLFAAFLGILIVAVPGTGRIIQLRRAARRHLKAAGRADSGHAGGEQPEAPGPVTRRDAGQRTMASAAPKILKLLFKWKKFAGVFGLSGIAGLWLAGQKARANFMPN